MIVCNCHCYQYCYDVVTVVVVVVVVVDVVTVVIVVMVVKYWRHSCYHCYGCCRGGRFCVIMFKQGRKGTLLYYEGLFYGWYACFSWSLLLLLLLLFFGVVDIIDADVL